MITKVEIRNLKQIESQIFEFSPFDLLIGRNNSGKSTVLQALAIWQYCVDEFYRVKRKGKTGTQVVLPNFTALPLPEFNLLWRRRIDRRSVLVDGARKPEYILIHIGVTFSTPGGEKTFGVDLRYSSPQTVYAIPSEGWDTFSTLHESGQLPRAAYVPPFSGLEPEEEWRDDGPIRRQIGKAQPGSVLRNLLLRVCPPKGDRTVEQQATWDELAAKIKAWFSVELLEPQYVRGVDTRIRCEYKQGNERYDLIAGGSGFHQVLMLLAFLHGYRPDVMLLDEPDAHMHVNLQREVLEYFRLVAQPRDVQRRGVQLVIGTHAEEFVKGVDATRLLMLPGARRVRSTSGAIAAMAEVENMEIARLADSPLILYVEGETDQRLLQAWAPACGAEEVLAGVCFRSMRGGNKTAMKEAADRHFKGITSLFPDARRLMLFDRDDAADWHPEPDNPVVYEWQRRNIENYLLVPDAWVAAGAAKLGSRTLDLFTQDVQAAVEDFFTGENLTLPPGQAWRTVGASVFAVVDGKQLLFEGAKALRQRLAALAPPVELTRDDVAGRMTPDQVHDDVHCFYAKLREMVASPPTSPLHPDAP